LRNNQVAFLRDARVRQALTDAADQTAMIRLVYLGHSAESRAPVPVDDPAFAADAAHAPVRDDPTLAARLLDEAGWRMGPAGIRVKDGKPLSFTAMVPAEGQDQIQEMQILQRNLQDAGVEMKLRTLSLDQVVDTLQQAGGTDWQAGLLGWTFAGLPDAAGFFHTNGAANFGGYSNSTMDRLVDDVQTKPGADSVSAFVAYAAEQQPWNFLPEGQFALMVADGVQGVADFASPQGFWSPEYLHLTGKRACAGDPK
jgi:peptide/nickel transport system substrate-binding protein